MTIDEIENIFNYHGPDEHQIIVYKKLRDKAKELAKLIYDHSFQSPELEQAIQYLSISNMLDRKSTRLNSSH